MFSFSLRDREGPIRDSSETVEDSEGTVKGLIRDSWRKLRDS